MTAPGAPTGLAVSATGTTSLRATWTAPSTGVPVRNYRLRWKLASGSYSARRELVVDAPRLLGDITGLTSGETYDVQVRAETIGGNSAWVTAVQGTTN